MFLSQATLVPGSIRKTDYTKIQSVYGMHATVWNFMSDGPNRTRDFLYYVDDVSTQPKILILSERLPEDSSGFWSIKTKKFAPKLLEGEHYSFFVKACPVKTFLDDKKKYDLVTHEKMRLRKEGVSLSEWPSTNDMFYKQGKIWLGRALERYGATLVSMELGGYGDNRVYKKRKEVPIQFKSVEFHGILLINRPNDFLEIFKRGIGKRKGFGYGMLMLKSRV